MKIHAEDSTETATESFPNKLLEFYIRILMVPVGKNKVGQYEFRMLSWRYFFSFLIWSGIPLAVTSYIIFDELEILESIGSGDVKFSDSVNFIFYQASHILLIMMVNVSPVCMGYLVENHNRRKTRLVLPSRKLEIISVIILTIIYNILV